VSTHLVNTDFYSHYWKKVGTTRNHLIKILFGPRCKNITLTIITM